MPSLATLGPSTTSITPAQKVEFDEGLLASKLKTRTWQSPLMPAHAGIQLSTLSRMRLKNLDSRVRGNEREGRFAFYRLG